MLSSREVDEFRRTILGYYRSCGRSFPGRETSDPYDILVSEIMLQQTQTERVVPKYTAWLQAFPSAAVLARSSLADVLSLWNGLGYNRRARFLQEACRIVAGQMDGIFPDDPDKLDALPGIGPYTARAVTTFAYGKSEVFIETNIRSVFIFFFFRGSDKVHDRDILPLVEQTLYREDPRSWYYALMDYGAELKKKVSNPNRKSRHYSRQSKFEGSLRQARGAVLRVLAEERGCGSAALCPAEYIAEKEQIDAERVAKAAGQLCAEGLVVRDGNAYRLPD